MPRVPVLQKEGNLRAIPAGSMGGALPTPRLAVPDTSRTDVAERATANLANTVKNVTFDIMSAAKQRADQIQLLDAQSQVDTLEMNHMNDVQALKGKDAFGVPQKYGQSFDAGLQKIRESLSNEEQRMAYDRMAVSRKNTFMGWSYNYERRALEDHAQGVVDGSMGTSLDRAVTNAGTPISELAINNGKDVYLAWAKLQGKPEAEVTKKLADYESKARYGVLSKLSDSDPKAAMDYYGAHNGKFTAEDGIRAQNLIVPVRRKYQATALASSVLSAAGPLQSKDDVINFVMMDLEGGDKIVADGGGVAKFGVNSKWHKDVDVPNLTPESARKFYSKTFWEKNNLDSYSPDFALVAFDSLVNHGDDATTHEMIKQADGNARKLLEIRADYYAKLAKDDPEENAPKLDGWMGRLKKLEHKLDNSPGYSGNEYDLYKKIDAQASDIEVAEDAKKIVKATLSARESSQKKEWEDTLQQAIDLRNQGKEVPPSIQARMKPEDLQKFRKDAPADHELYWKLKQRVLSGDKVNLADYRLDIGEDNYKSLIEAANDPAKKVNEKIIDDAVKKGSTALIGRVSPATPDDYTTIQAFERRVRDDINAFERRAGKPADEKDVQTIVDRNMLNINVSRPSLGFDIGGTEARMYERKPGESFELDDIPQNGVHKIKGQVVSYDELVNYLVTATARRGIPITNESIAETWKAMQQARTLPDGSVVNPIIQWNYE